MLLVITHATLVELTVIVALMLMAVFFARILIRILMEVVSAVKVWDISMMTCWIHVSSVLVHLTDQQFTSKTVRDAIKRKEISRVALNAWNALMDIILVLKVHV